jgi:hypothetical protein
MELGFVESLLLANLIVLVVLVVVVLRREPEATVTISADPWLQAALRGRLDRPVQVVFPTSYAQAMRRVQEAAIDVQGIIALYSRYLVSQMPPEAVADILPESTEKQ